MKKAWNVFNASQPKAARNWEPGNGGAKTKPPTVSKPKPQQKKKPPGKPKEQKQEEPAFEDVIFETPPVTPPPEKVHLAPKKEKDSEFWDYYDK